MHTRDVRAAAHALGGDVSGHGGVVCPGPGHSREDRSLSVKFDLAAPDGFVVYSFASDDSIACRDYVRERLGLEPFGRRQNRSHPPRIRAASPPDDTVDRIGWARSIWRATVPAKGAAVDFKGRSAAASLLTGLWPRPRRSIGGVSIGQRGGS